MPRNTGKPEAGKPGPAEVRERVCKRSAPKKGHGASMCAGLFLADTVNDEIYDDEEWPVEEVTVKDLPD